MKHCKIIIEDEVHCRLIGLLPKDIEFLWDKFGIMIEGARHTPQFQLRRWDGKVRFFQKDGKTYTKILDEIIPYLVTWEYEIDADDKRSPNTNITQRASEDYFGNHIKLRPYQVCAINDLIEEGQGFGILATGAGKSILCACLSHILAINNLRTIVIVPSSDLVSQTKSAFQESLSQFDITIGEFSGDIKDIHHPIVVATWQSLQNYPHYMIDFNAVIVDECQGIRGQVIRELINDHGKHIQFRYGVTGTLPKEKADVYNLKISIGRVVTEVNAKWLIDNGFLAEVNIIPIETIDEDNKFPDYAAEKAFLSRNDDRLIALAAQIITARDKYGNTLVLVNSVAQGKLLRDIIQDSVFLSGESKKDDRKEQYDSYEDRDDLIVIATYGIASTGISINRIFCLVMIDAAKSFIRSVQSIGRSLRKGRDKNRAYVLDIYSKLKFSKKHAKLRMGYYKEAGYPTEKPKKYDYL